MTTTVLYSKLTDGERSASHDAVPTGAEVRMTITLGNTERYSCFIRDINSWFYLCLPFLVGMRNLKYTITYMDMHYIICIVSCNLSLRIWLQLTMNRKPMKVAHLLKKQATVRLAFHPIDNVLCNPIV